MREWLEQLRTQSQCLGQWRRRRNALPNIMVLRNMNTDMNNDHSDEEENTSQNHSHHERYPSSTLSSSS
ncbi:hypothetical protein BLA29_002063 [Euroglyphus maynei]|uniref:Uncharacterized protein n=1 Tax=Euroglyphus maynei TaxID=6958 RepID=A0A1Y3BA67_EURMA|nr:hypothetical protein BLA29_002063 [Euroglyphus maynei]